MIKSSFAFDFRRFARLLLNDTLNWFPKVLMATALVLFVFIFLFFDATFGSMTHLYFDLLPYLLIMFFGAALFTSIIFSDIHHPLGRFNCLTLPCSLQERFLSKYLLTGPIFFIYLLLVFEIFRLIMPWLTKLIFDISVEMPGLDSAYKEFVFGRGWNFEENTMVPIYITYFLIHIVAFFGGIFFRSFSLIKTGFSFVALIFSCIFVGFISIKLVYFDYFTNFFSVKVTNPIGNDFAEFLFGDRTYMYILWALIYLWITFLSYSCLKDHEA